VPSPVILSGADAEQQRLALLARAAVALSPADAPAQDDHFESEISRCRFLPDSPSGTTPKFTCLLPSGERVKVKYGRHPEIHAEVAATRLLRMLGYPADTVMMVPRLRCDGCPRYPFSGSFVLSNAVTRHLIAHGGEPAGYTDFEWVSVERKFPAVPIETGSSKGWHWWEIDRVRRDADTDALKLLATFLAHWDNKSENQRLVCLDEDPQPACRRPLALIQDLGATFGPMKTNLAQWRDLPVWHDRTTCTVSMRGLPYHGASFPDAVISEAGRAQLAAQLTALGADDIRALFAYARFPEYQSGTDDRKDLDAWTAAFRHRADQIAQARCSA